MSGKAIKNAILLAIAACLLFGVSRVQSSMNKDREKLGLTRIDPLDNAPPVLAFTTVALGGFRGLISNALWMRMSDLQDEDKFFEMAQLADWITKLEPHFVQVWLVQAWNMAYNISVKFKDYPDRWRWVEKGIELLRDDGLRYNPNELLIYRELGWFFQHKLGQNLDDASMLYKQNWSMEMSQVFGTNKPNLNELVHPQTAEASNRVELLTTKYKMDPVFVKYVDDTYGPLEWRLPEAHAIYWAAKGLEAAKNNPTKVKKDDLITLRRVIYQSMQLSFQRGRMEENQFIQAFELGPNLDIIPKVSFAYEQASEDDVENHDHILKAHRNFLRDAVYFLYENNRLKEAAYWFKYLGDRYPDKTLLDNKPDSLPRNLTLDQYSVGRIQEEVGDGGKDRTQATIEGLLRTAYLNLARDADDRYEGLKLLAHQVWISYMSRMPEERLPVIGLAKFEVMDREVLDRMLDPKNGLRDDVRAVIATKLRLPLPPAAPPATPPGATNAVPEKLSSK
jgi:hypothetical protein